MLILALHAPMSCWEFCCSDSIYYASNSLSSKPSENRKEQFDQEDGGAHTDNERSNMGQTRLLGLVYVEQRSFSTFSCPKAQNREMFPTFPLDMLRRNVILRVRHFTKLKWEIDNISQQSNWSAPASAKSDHSLRFPCLASSLLSAASWFSGYLLLPRTRQRPTEHTKLSTPCNTTW